MNSDLMGHPSRPAHKQRLALLGVALLLAMLLLAGRQPDTAAAHNDYCTTYSSGWYCNWKDPNLAPGTPHWFEASVTLRNWNFAAVIDGHGGSVYDKCVHMMRGSDGYRMQIACGPNVAEGFTPTWMRPGYLFTRHGAGGARSIIGDGAHG